MSLLGRRALILVGQAHKVVQRVQVEMHFARILWLEVARLQLNRHQTVQAPMEEQQVDEKPCSSTDTPMITLACLSPTYDGWQGHSVQVCPVSA